MKRTSLNLEGNSTRRRGWRWELSWGEIFQAEHGQKWKYFVMGQVKGLVVLLSCCCLLTLTRGTPVLAGEQAPGPLPVISVSPIDVAHVVSITKFRSCVGHDYSPGGSGKPGNSGTLERGRSMKHHISTDVPPLPVHGLRVFAPYAGSIHLVVENHPLGKQVHVVSNGWSFIFFHVDPLVREGQRVKAGAPVGTIAPANVVNELKVGPGGKPFPYSFDFALTSSTSMRSFFSAMNQKVASQWASHGYAKSKAIISKTARDRAPCALSSDGFSFAQPAGTSADFVFGH